MKLLINKLSKVVEHFTYGEYKLSPKSLEIWEGARRKETWMTHGSDDVEVVEVEESKVPPKVHLRYQYIDGKFIRYKQGPQYEEARQLTKWGLLKRLTLDEQVAIEAASKTDLQVCIVNRNLTIADQVDLDDPTLVNCCNCW